MKPGFRKPHTTYALGLGSEQLFPKGIRATGLAPHRRYSARQVEQEICVPECAPLAEESWPANICTTCAAKRDSQRIDAALGILKRAGRLGQL